MHTDGWRTFKKRAFLPLLLSAGLVLAGCGGSSGTTPAASSGGGSATLKIGALMDVSQTYAFIGKPALAGLRTYVDVVNKAGGVGGYMLEVEALDTRADAVTAKTQFEQMKSDGVVAILGPNDSKTLVPIAPLFPAAKIPNLTSAAISTLHSPAQAYLFATSKLVADHALIASDWMKTRAAEMKVAAPKVAVLTLDTPSLQGLRDNLVKGVPAITKGTIVRNDVVAPTATDMTSAALPIIAANPDFVQVGLLPTQVPGLVKALRDRGIKAPVMNYAVASDLATFQAVNDAEYYADRDYAEPTETDNPGVEKMKAAAQAAGQTADMTNAYFTYGYASGMLIAEAVKACGTGCNGEKLNTALEKITSLDPQGLTGTLGVNPPADNLFVKYGRIWSYDPATKAAKADSDWIKTPALPAS